MARNTLSKNNFLMRNFPRLSPMRGDTLAKDTKSKKGIIGSQQRGNHNVFSHYPTFYKISETITADHKILSVETSRDADSKNALIVQDDFTNLIQSPMKTKETLENCSVYKDFSSVTGNLHRPVQRHHSCRDLQWNHDTGTPCSETNGVAEPSAE